MAYQMAMCCRNIAPKCVWWYESFQILQNSTDKIKSHHILRIAFPYYYLAQAKVYRSCAIGYSNIVKKNKQTKTSTVMRKAHAIKSIFM